MSSPAPATAVATTAARTKKAAENTGRWTKEEHEMFIDGLRRHGKEWKTIAQMVSSRTVVQIRTHAQKYFQKLSKQMGQQAGDSSPDSSPIKSSHKRPATKRARRVPARQRTSSSSDSSSSYSSDDDMEIAPQSSMHAVTAVPMVPAAVPTPAPAAVSVRPYMAPVSIQVPSHHDATRGYGLDKDVYGHAGEYHTTPTGVTEDLYRLPLRDDDAGLHELLGGGLGDFMSESDTFASGDSEPSSGDDMDVLSHSAKKRRTEVDPLFDSLALPLEVELADSLSGHDYLQRFDDLL